MVRPCSRASKCSGNAAGECSGNVLVKATVPTRLLAARDATEAKKRITLGKRRFSVAAGEAKNIVIALRKPARKIFAKTRRLRGVKVIVNNLLGAGVGHEKLTSG